MKRFGLAILMIAVLMGCSHSNALLEVKTPVRPAGQEDVIGLAAEPIDTVRIGVIGIGMRGRGAVYRFNHIPGAKVVAICDLLAENVAAGQQRLAKAGKPAAAEYVGEGSWKALCERDDLDLIYIVTDWKNHAHMGVYAMEQGKHVAIEVPAAMTMDEIWQLIETSERTRKHCMQLENCVYDFFELTTLNMAQHGLFGDVLHVEGAYIHNLEEFWDMYHENWRLKYNKEYRGDVYPTHGIGPVCQVLNIHRGDRMKTLVSMDTKSVTGPEVWKKITGEECDSFANGDHTTTMIGTENGKTILIEHNVMTPRPYDRMYQLTGTKGFANKYPVQQYCLASADGVKNLDHENLDAHKAVSEEMKVALMEEFKHPIHKELEQKAKEVGGHGGMDFIMDYRLIYCLRNGLPLDMDVYDLAEWCCLAELSRLSIENGNRPVAIPDFTRGSWNKVKGYRHAFVGDVQESPLPDPLVMQNGKTVRNVRQWERVRRPELLDLFEKEMFGRTPGKPADMHFKLLSEDPKAFDGLATRKEVAVYFNAADTSYMTLLMHVPNDRKGPVPAFMGINFKGNHATSADPGISLPTDDQIRRYGPDFKMEPRDANGRRWPYEYILSKGYAVVTFYRGDVDPDYHDGFKNGVHAVIDADKPRTGESWGTISAWAWALSRALDYLETDGDIDSEKVAVMGHSRLGKTALWAGATDPRFALVISNDSGCSGAALSRRNVGESVEVINRSFPHWFCDNYKKYGADVQGLPFDQHELISLIAPRPVYVASASKDTWADPEGEFLSIVNASPVYALYGYKGLEREVFPPVNTPLSSDRMGYHLREGKHDVVLYDWEQFVSFADRFLK